MCNYMRTLLLVSFPLLLSAFWLDKQQTSSDETTLKLQTKIHTDSTVTLFGDSSYKLTVHIFNSTNYGEGTSNAVVTFRKQDKMGLKIFFCDSVYCMYPDIDFYDFNNDKTKDVTIFHYTGGRANPTYYLYLIDLKNRRLIRVKGFEELPNPDLDTTNNIIGSIALSGTSGYYSFYRINSKNKLIALGHGFENDPNDSTQYEKAVRQIQKENK
jgi:hypothetical protein